MTTFDDKERIQLFRRTRRAKMQEIIPNLWLGSQEASHDRALLRKHSITHMLTVMPTFVDDEGEERVLAPPQSHKYFDAGSVLHRLIIPIEDRATENLLQNFPVSTEFILGAICSGGKVLVHCLAGASRSPTIVLAFLMEVFRVSPPQALSKIRESRPLVRPILGFLDQLQVYEACGYRPTNQPVYLHWKLRAQCETEIRPRPLASVTTPQIANTTGYPKVFAKIPLDIPYITTRIQVLYCAACRVALAPCSSLLPRNHDSDDYYLAQPVDWMAPEFDNREHAGILACPNCEELVGEYDWNGWLTSSGDWLTPAFALLQNAVKITE